MKSIKRAVALIAISCGLLVGGAAAANADTDYPDEGGTWEHGFSWTIVYSAYWHPDRTHGSTACNAYLCEHSGWYSRGYKSWTQVPTTYWGNTVWYSFP